MSNRYYLEGESRAAGVRDLFGVVAPRYDLINDLQSLGLHRFWKRRVIRAAEIRPGESALDLCCGTGDIAFALAAAGADVTGVDFSEPMLAVARRRLQAGWGRRHSPGEPGPADSSSGASQGDNPRFEQGDAMSLRFHDAAFDVVTIGYGLRNLPDIDRGLSEISRVVRPGGRVVILDFGKPPNRLWRSLYFLHLRTVVPLLSRTLLGDAETHAYILESLLKYPSAADIARRMEGARLRSVEWWNLFGGAMTLHRGRR